MSSTTLTPIDIEAAIVARLVDRLKTPGLVKFVYDTREYGEVKEQSQLTPSVCVIYNGYQPGDQVGQGQVQQVVVEFLVVIVARSSKQTLRASGAKATASEIFDAVMKALAGWKPGEGVSRLKLAPTPGAGYSDAGFTYLPTAFTTSVTYTQQP